MPEIEKPGHPESPTTARELDFDDEPQESGILSPTMATHDSSSQALRQPDGNEVPPVKPPRPMSPQQQAENTLKDAFPSIDAAVIKAVLVASGGKVEPAFNALLSMSDPDSQIEPTPPPQPPRPIRTSSGPTSTAQSQLEADERYARQLAQHYSTADDYNAPRSGRGQNPRLPGQRQETGLKPNELYDDKEHSFIDDDLPVIRENIRKGFLETQSKVNSWVANLKKKLDGEDEEFGGPSSGQNQGFQNAQYGNRRSGEMGRRSVSGDYQRYDADPKVLSDDFSGLELRDAEAINATAESRRSHRPLANPDLFKPTPPAPQSNRRVSFQDGPPDEINDLYSGSSDPAKRSSSATRSSKWQPLSTVDPSPVAEHDPFSLGDSDDEKEAKSKDLKAEDTERLKKAAAEAMAEGIGNKGSMSMEASETTGPHGTKDKEAEEKLAKS
ncbi:MAG: ubiquitin-binding protein cue5 [Cirrosporium novae-zelandiae]|nr:MAG: ubiquitin-binding protein cue5 [Cirrosporium novae-zelandiae]